MGDISAAERQLYRRSLPGAVPEQTRVFDMSQGESSFNGANVDLDNIRHVHVHEPTRSRWKEGGGDPGTGG